MGGMRRRVRRLERCSGTDDALMKEARALIMDETLTRVSDGDLRIMGDFAEQTRRQGGGGEEWGVQWGAALEREHPELWCRFQDLYRETGEEMARGG